MLPRRTAVLAVAFGLAVAAALGAHRSSPAGSTGNAATGARVEAIGITVADMDRSVRFYSTVLFFEKVSDAEVRGGEHEALEGVPGARLRVVRMRLGDELVELRQWRAPTGRPLPADSRSHDRWFQHLALVVNDMDQAYLWLRRHQVA
ncbi:MAG: VOC family protein, partial [Candidatus Rokubacteria bacterium]|nr:VOC family protein [Candidatus Rokubacteria bacterium]